VPKKAVFIFFLLAFLGAALFIFFTFPRTKEEIPTSNNQRPFPSAPLPGPNGVPVPDAVPHPNQPPPQHGPSLRVMAWAGADDVKAIRAEADAFEATTGHRASLTIEGDMATYRLDLQQALASDTPPDVCLIDARDFSGTDPVRDLADVTPDAGTAPRSMAAFTVAGAIKAVPAEFSVDLLFYNPDHFDRAGIGYPDRHWNWDILEAMSRALVSLHLKDAAGEPIYPLELPADFDFWNVLCTQAGHPALDSDVWHLSDVDQKDSQMRALDFIHDMFHELTVTAPLEKAHAPAGRLFAQQRASLLIAPSEITASLPKFRYAFTLPPGDINRASLARVNGWAVVARSSQPEAARSLALFLARQPVHAGWSSVQKPADDAGPAAICYEALGQSVIPRIEPKTAPLAQFLDQQIDLLARNSRQTTDALYARIQTEYRNGFASPMKSVPPQVAGLKASPSAEVRGL
jgi:ABC-type glycerol-3-phosphate transport system substrate-binding protein